MSTGGKKPAIIKAEKTADGKGWFATVHATPDTNPDGPGVFTTDTRFADEKSATQEAQNWSDTNGFDTSPQNP